MFNNFADRLYVLRRLRGLGSAEAAKKIGVTNSSICAWEMGRTYPHLSSVRLIAQELNCSVSWLMGEAPIDAIEGADK